ncbi:hypothetical protein M404DRAFT_36502 [Pisolithus tinctorius Marx 270]|uniref:Uncharacterized protein n=1 Tax=Pisolithus tinctorius Marx 270 TaxID=870435 RepID=A0A0C3I721_PISTI|nr:hypothetical protein M404DRAFT_36506 [Pisolithus tinctorius Marx 270]KIN92994.1 hypothetical protein M404DRAFT_36502 [Pisolithus tinctorius Marx 270]
MASHPDDPYLLTEVIKAAKFLLMGSALHSAVLMMATTASPAAPPSPAYMPQVPPAGTVVKQEYNFQMQHLPQQCRPSCSFCADPNHWTRMCTLVQVYICAGKIMRGADNHLYLADRNQIPHFPECNSLREAIDCIMADRDQASAHALEIQPSAFLNTVQDVNEPVTDLANPDFQAYVTQAWATYQADKATVEEEIISPGVQSSCAACQASKPSAPVPTPTAVKPYVPPTNPTPAAACKDPTPTAVVLSQTPYPAAHNQNQYHCLFPLEDEATPKHIMECMLETSTTLPVKELFAVAPEFHKQFRDITMAKCITTNEIEVVHSDNEEGVHINKLTSHNPQ